MREIVIANLSMDFALRIVNLYKYLCNEKAEYVMSKQLLRCGTSIGANISEGIRGQSKQDFYAKMNIALKEANETNYWLDLLFATGYVEEPAYRSLSQKCEELISILVAITKTQTK